jgi:GT2 family glycosyltransferase
VASRPSGYDEIVAEMKERRAEKERADKSDAVVVAYVHRLDVGYAWHHSMIELLGHDLANQQRIMHAGYIAMTAETDGLSKARNKTVETFLEEGKADWLWWIDTDMGFSKDTIDRLMADADPEERPVVGGLAFTARQEKSDDLGGWRILATPTIFDWGQDGDQEGFIVRWNYFQDVLQSCDGTGSACILIHKSVFEKISEKFGPGKWYDRFFNPKMNQLTSEDLSFCMRAQTATGKKIFVDSSVKTTHQKTLWLQEADYFAQRALAEIVDAAVPSVPPATEPTAIIVPVLGRPQNAAPFMESLKASGADLANVYAVVDLDDQETAEAWASEGAGVALFDSDENGTFAEKVNYAYRVTDEPWLFLVGDDVQFHPGWLDHAQHAARDGAHVIGTNDLHNPRVTSGEHATHLLIRRNYIDERGASWDGPKVVCHEGYRHNFVDDEIVKVAKQRGVWVFAEHSKVEHLHPLWGLAENDDTYRLGQSRVGADNALWKQRKAEYG